MVTKESIFNDGGYDCCMCGNSLDNPSGCYANGHSPRSMREYYNELETTEEESKGTNTMNYTSAVMLFNDNIKAIKVSYDPNEDYRQYIFKTLETDLEVGDLMIVSKESKHGFTVVRVEELDVEVDFDSNTQLKWAVKFDQSGYNSTLEEEGKWIEAMRKSEKKAKRDQIKANMQEYFNDEDANQSIALLGTSVDTSETPLPADDSATPTQAV